MEHVLVYILKSENPNGVLTNLSADPDDWKDVAALIKYGNDTTDCNLRMLLMSGNTKHELLFNHDCQYKALQQSQFDQLVVEYACKRL